MKVIGIVQARMSSKRLPGKVLLEAAGKPLILHMLERVSRCRHLGGLWLATSGESSDDALAGAVREAGYKVFRGSLDNVLSRFWQIGKKEEADAVVRLTGDCPLHDAEVIDLVISHFCQGWPEWDYVSNVMPPTYPDGLDTEVFTFRALERAYHTTQNAFDLEHVTPFIRSEAVQSGRTGNIQGSADFSHLRWTLDEPEDFVMIKGAYEALYPLKKTFGWLDVVAWQTREPERLKMNAMHKRNRKTVRFPHE